MTIALDRRSKLDYVNGHIKPLNPSSQAYQAWQCKDQLVMSSPGYSALWRIILLRYSTT